MSSIAAARIESPSRGPASLPVDQAVRHGLTSSPKTLPPWLFYDDAGSELFEQITRLPEYYLTRTERALFAAHAAEIVAAIPGPLSVVELGAGTAAKTGILLRALTGRQPRVLYQPIDISPSALDEASALASVIPGLTVLPVVANYVNQPLSIGRAPGARVLALYIGSSIGNFSPAEARGILQNLRAGLQPGDALLLGVDLAPSLPNGHPGKSVSTLLAAYNDAAGITAAFNRNILVRINRDLGANFQPLRFRHCALWNAGESRIEMHLQSTCPQHVRIPASHAGPALDLHFAPGETIHTENSCKFTRETIASLLTGCGFRVLRRFTDSADLFAVTLAAVA
ncbi:MAG: L-histidine N(alpha)-methyltransferase [Acidobacteriota bacterium]|nr:L-histidine N(alpha)-methyltransferase [Acidobacteriota bacterium]